MKHMTIKKLTSSTFLTFATITASSGLADIQPVLDPVIDLSNAVYAGQGCDENSVSLTTINGEHGRSVLIVEFDRLNANVSGKLMADRSSCLIRAIMHLPASTKLVVESTQAYGQFDATNEVRGSAAYSISPMGYQVPVSQKTLDSRTDASGAFLIQNQDSFTTNCVAQRTNGLLGINAAGSLQVVRTSSGPNAAFVSIDRLEITYRVEHCAP